MMTRGSASAALVAMLISGCIGGQTGDPNGGELGAVPTPEQCEPTDLTVGIDQRLPGGFSVRELLESVADVRVPAFIWDDPSELEALVQNNERGTITPEQADGQTELHLQIRYDGENRIPVYQGACLGSSELFLPVTLLISAQDGSLEREVPGELSGTLGAAQFTPAHFIPIGTAEQLCRMSPVEVRYVSTGVAYGRICDDDGRELVFPAACGGTAQAALDERVTEDLPLPSDVLSMQIAQPRYELKWNDSELALIEITLEQTGELACHYEGSAGDKSWVVPVSARLDWIDDDFTLAPELQLVAEQNEVDIDGSPISLGLHGCMELGEDGLSFFAQRVGTTLAMATLCVHAQSSGDGRGLVLSIDGYTLPSDGGTFSTGRTWPMRPVVDP